MEQGRKGLASVCNLPLVTGGLWASTHHCSYAPRGGNEAVSVGRGLGRIVPSPGGYNLNFLRLGQQLLLENLKNVTLKMHLSIFPDLYSPFPPGVSRHSGMYFFPVCGAGVK